MPEVTMVSAYHNYLADGRLRRELVLGDRSDPEGFFLIAHQVGPGDPMPLISGRFFGTEREFLLRIERNDLTENPNGFSVIENPGGWALMDTSMEALLSAEVRAFENGFLSVLRGVLFGPSGQPVVRGDDRGLHILNAK